MGEDESSIRTHQKPMRRPRDEGHGSPAHPEQPSPSVKTDSASQRDENAESQSQSTYPSPSSKWSWVGHRSPLMDSREEAEWILDRLERKLKAELQSVVREKRGADGFERVRLEEDNNEQRPLEVTPIQRFDGH